MARKQYDDIKAIRKAIMKSRNSDIIATRTRVYQPTIRPLPDGTELAELEITTGGSVWRSTQGLEVEQHGFMVHCFLVLRTAPDSKPSLEFWLSDNPHPAYCDERTIDFHGAAPLEGPITAHTITDLGSRCDLTDWPLDYVTSGLATCRDLLLQRFFNL